jgi:hypothetical protein
VKTLLSFDPVMHVKPVDVCEASDPKGLLMAVLGIPAMKSSASREDLFYVGIDSRHTFNTRLSFL